MKKTKAHVMISVWKYRSIMMMKHLFMEHLIFSDEAALNYNNIGYHELQFLKVCFFYRHHELKLYKNFHIKLHSFLLKATVFSYSCAIVFKSKGFNIILHFRFDVFLRNITKLVYFTIFCEQNFPS